MGVIEYGPNDGLFAKLRRALRGDHPEDAATTAAPSVDTTAARVTNTSERTIGLSAEERAAIDSGNLIEAIASVHKRVGCSLAEAKRAVDAYRSDGT